MKLSKTKLVLIECFNKGYRCTNDGAVLNKDGKQIKLSIKNGYKFFSIRFFKERYIVYVHRLMGYQKFGSKCLLNGIEIRHLNNIKEDNSFENIGIGTHSDNMMDIPKIYRQLKSKKANKKYSDEFITEIKNQRIKGLTYKELSNKYGVSKSTLSYYLSENGKKKEVNIRV